jgi:hypothetical protein
MQILVVTCDRDRWQFQIQCWSIGKYLEPCELHFIINEANPSDWLDWFNATCRCYLGQHRVHVYTFEDFANDIVFYLKIFDNKAGWQNQQVYKLIFALKTQQPYIILDSKNWFVKPAKLTDMVKPKRHVIQPPADFDRFYIELLNKFNFPDAQCRGIITPFHMDPVVVLKLFEHFGGVDSFINWFLSFRIQSEFMVYDLFAQYAGLDHDPGAIEDYYRNFWYTEVALDIEKFKLALAEPCVKMVSIHYPLLKSVNPSVIESLLKIN